MRVVNAFVELKFGDCRMALTFHKKIDNGIKESDMVCLRIMHILGSLYRISL